MTYLHRQISHITRFPYPWHTQQIFGYIIMHAGGFGIRPQGVLLHHPQIGTRILDQHARIIHHAAVHTRHGQCHADQQAQTDAGENEFSPSMQNVAAR